LETQRKIAARHYAEATSGSGNIVASAIDAAAIKIERCCDLDRRANAALELALLRCEFCSILA
jgi:hypothetical protein